MLPLLCRGNVLKGRSILTTSGYIRWCSSNMSEIVNEFNKQSTWFESDWSSRSLSSTESLMQWVMSHIDINKVKDKYVLDVASGTGIFARWLAKHGAYSVTCIDATPGMIEQAKNSCQTEGYNDNIFTFMQGDALNMPFEDNSFDFVASRLAIHHFPNPIQNIKEMKRVMKPGGILCIVDIISHDDVEIAKEMNRLERLRDPTHTWAYNTNELLDLIKEAGLAPTIQSSQELPMYRNTMDLQGWMSSTNTVPAHQVTIERSVDIELGGGSPCGLRPVVKDGKVCFEHIYTVVQGEKV